MIRTLAFGAALLCASPALAFGIGEPAMQDFGALTAGGYATGAVTVPPPAYDHPYRNAVVHKLPWQVISLACLGLAGINPASSPEVNACADWPHDKAGRYLPGAVCVVFVPMDAADYAALTEAERAHWLVVFASRGYPSQLDPVSATEAGNLLRHEMGHCNGHLSDEGYLLP